MSLALGDKINETMENINDKFGSILFTRFIAQKSLQENRSCDGNAVR